MAILLGVSTVLIVLLLSGMVQQERIRLWHRHQERLAEKRLEDLDKHKQDATDRVRKMLHERRAQIDASGAKNTPRSSPEEDSPPSGLSEASGSVAPLNAN